MTTKDQVHPKGRDPSEPIVYHERFESKYKVGDVVYANDRETGRKRPGTFTLKGQFQTGDHEGWWANNATGGTSNYQEANRPVLDVDIREVVSFSDKVVQPRRVEVDWV